MNPSASAERSLELEDGLALFEPWTSLSCPSTSGFGLDE